jgi:hypothetical protein
MKMLQNAFYAFLEMRTKEGNFVWRGTASRIHVYGLWMVRCFTLGTSRLLKKEMDENYRKNYFFYVENF